jgi:hypothetical protein
MFDSRPFHFVRLRHSERVCHTTQGPILSRDLTAEPHGVRHCHTTTNITTDHCVIITYYRADQHALSHSDLTQRSHRHARPIAGPATAARRRDLQARGYRRRWTASARCVRRDKTIKRRCSWTASARHARRGMAVKRRCTLHQPRSPSRRVRVCVPVARS